MTGLRLPRLPFLFALTALAACSAVLDTKPYSGDGTAAYAPEDASLAQSCVASASAYSLPKAVVVFDAEESDGSPRAFSLTDPALKWVTDGAYGPFCLNYLGSPFAEDALGIEHAPGNESLARVANRALDRSKDVAISLLEAAGDAAAAQAGGGRSVDIDSKIANGSNKPIYAHFEFDPFDRSAMEMNNTALKKIGYCVFIDAKQSAFAPSWTNDVCSETGYPPAAPRFDLKDPAGAAAMPDPIKFVGRGILYRPPVAYTLVIMKRDDPTSRDFKRFPWYLQKSLDLQLPNGAPIFLLEIKRSMFVERVSDIRFENGVPYDITVAKKSELNAVSDVVVRAVQVVVQVPLRALTIRLNAAQNEQKLIAANSQLLKAINDYQVTRQTIITPGTAKIAGADDDRPRSVIVADPTGLPISPRSTAVADCMRDQRFGNDPDGPAICQQIVDQGQ